MVAPGQPALFKPSYGRAWRAIDHTDDPPPAQQHSSTSRRAARTARKSTNQARERVLAFLRDRGTAGATDAEMQAALCLDGSTQRPRRIELVRAGLVKAIGKRPTPAGRAATVWAVASAGGAL